MRSFVCRTAPLVAAVLMIVAPPAELRGQDAPPPDVAVAALVPAQGAPPPPPPPGAPAARTPDPDHTPERQPPPPPPPPPPAAGARTGRTVTARPGIGDEGPIPAAERAYVSKGVNIRIDATVTESRAEQTLGKKVVSITLVDG